MGMEESDVYPLGDGSLVPIGLDVQRYRARFLEDSRRLFDGQGKQLEIIRILWNNEVISCHSAEKTESTIEHIKINTSEAKDCFYLIPQNFTWGQLCISQQILQTILTSHHVFVPFLDFLQSYGLRIHDNQHNWNGCRTNFPPQPSLVHGRQFYEFCYNLEYMEKNGRAKGNPWSLRQTTVYHQIDLKNGQSCWIFLQASKDIRAQLERNLYNKVNSVGIDPVLLHVGFLSAMACNWSKYIEYLHMQLAELDEKACHSNLGNNVAHDYSVTFDDCQKLQLLRQNLLKTSVILDSCLKIVKGCEGHCLKLISLHLTSLGEQGLAEISVYAAQIKCHRRGIIQIIQQSLGTSNLLFKIIEFRSDETLRDTNRAMHNTLGVLRHITSQSQQENATVAVLARQGQQDSKTLKALSMVATVYLPATLIATIFSSSLVTSQSNNGSGASIASSSHMVVSSQFWVFALISAALTVLTLTGTLLLKQIWLKGSSVGGVPESSPRLALPNVA